MDLAATIALQLAIVALVAGAFRRGGRAIDYRWFAAVMAAVVAYFLVIVVGSEAQDLIPALSGLKWNWVGKAIAIGFSLLLILGWIGREAAGLRLRQAAGSALPCLVVVAAMCALSWGAEAWANDGRDLSLERLAFQATMPGIDEELFLRGVLLALMVRAVGPSDRRGGAPFGLAEALVTLFFALGHGVAVASGQLHVDALAFFLTGVLGAGLAWLRTRSGSLAWPIAAHNLVNFGNSFF
ncbi:CPBP family intramembrane glutamic endopeptidase [Sphingomonas sp. ASV193]|uniref:CPBP family intramembrane glutamic endopeptidase n=1 Tax=Sphingomonas sp. ASV193 TaxID=3144405 RepID=UPI0032E8D18D